MAIVIEEERQKGGIFNVLIWLVILAGIGAGAYYVFFAKPELIENVGTPSGFENTEQISRIELHPEDILTNPQFKALVPHVTIPPDPETGRSNPFIGF